MVTLSSYLKAEDRQLLQQELDLVAVLHHRNKNQHHGASWYKYLKYLKSCLSRVLSIPVLDPDSTISKAKRLAQDKILAQFEHERESFLVRARAIYLGFSQVVGTGQYVPLGLVLLGVLARVWKIILGPQEQGLASAQDTEDEVILEEGLEHSDTDLGVVLDRAVLEATSNSNAQVAASNPSVSQVTTAASSKIATPVKRSATSSPLQSTPASSKKQKKKKKKKSEIQDEIDSIFG